MRDELPPSKGVSGGSDGLDDEALAIVLVEHLAEELEQQAEQQAEQQGESGVSDELPGATLIELGELVRDGSIGCVTTTLDGVIEDVNESAARMFGYARAELRGMPALALVHPAHAVDVEAAVGELAAGRRTFYEAARVYRHRDGHKVPVRCTVRRLESPDGGSLRVVALLEDLSSRVTAIARRLGAERARQNVLDTATDAFISIDSDSCVLDWNVAATELFGYSAAEAIGQDLASLIIPVDLVEQHRHAVDHVAAGGVPSIIGQAVELRARHRDGSPLCIELTPWSTPSDSSGTQFHAFCRDIAERVTSREAMAQANRQIAQSREQLKAAFEASPTADAIVDSAGILVEVNPALCRLLGSRPEATVGRSWLSLFRESDVTHAQEIWADLRTTGHVTPRTEIRCSRADGSVIWGLISLMAMPGEAQVERVMLRIEDIQNSKDLEEALVRQASYDAITGLPNRALFLEHVRRALGPRPNPVPAAFVSVILQGLHGVIDEHGYAAGDHVLLVIAQRLSAHLPEDVTLAHVQPGQFALMVPSGQHDAMRLSQRIIDVLRTPVVSAGVDVSMRVGIGISAETSGPTEGATQVGRVLQDADSAARQALKAGANRVAFAVPEMRRAQQHQDRMESIIRDALDHDTLMVAYQPVFDLSTGSLVGAEALLRVRDRDGTRIPPLEVIAVAESSGQIIEIGRRVLQLAARQAAAWLGDHDVLVPVAVNVSAVQLGRADFVGEVLGAVEEAGVPAQALSLELTESVLLEAGSLGIEQLTTLRDAGIQLAIDDFGTGYASLSYLRDLPASTLKIDRSFVDGIPHDVGAVAIVAGVIGLAKNFGMSCIAEGIETEAQRIYLAEREVLGQGYLLGRPGHASDISKIIGEAAAPSPVVASPVRSFAEARDQAGNRRDFAADERDQAGDQRDQGGDQRDRAGNQRDDAADERDRAGDQRDLAADERDLAADNRDRAGRTRDRAAERRDTAAEASEADGPSEGLEANTGLAASVRREAAADRWRASQDRAAGASERAQAGLDRDTALTDRGAGASERVQAELDRNIALADRGSGAGERVRAEGDRAIASADRVAAAGDRAALSIDDVTGVYLRGPGLVELERDMARARRTQASLVLAFVDVDRLKTVNDTHGHAFGDRVLRDVADSLRSALRPYDLIVRVGGDEFICAVVGLARPDAEQRFASVNDHLSQQASRPSVTIGLSEMRSDDNAQQLLSRADTELRNHRARRTTVSPLPE